MTTNDKTDGASGDLGDDDDRTPTERPPRRPASDTALRLARAATLLNAIATKFGAAAGGVDRLGPDERALFVRRICADGRVTARALVAFLDDIEAAG